MRIGIITVSAFTYLLSTDLSLENLVLQVLYTSSRMRSEANLVIVSGLQMQGLFFEAFP